MSELTRCELEHARDVVRRRWTAAAVRELHDLPRDEQMVVAELCALLDAEPIDPVTLEPLRPRCAFCGASEFPMSRTDTGWVCTFEPACRYRTRVRVGVPKWRAYRDLQAEKAALR